MSPPPKFLHISGFGSCLNHSFLLDFFLPPLHTQMFSEGHVFWDAHWKFAYRPFHAQERTSAYVLCDGSIVAPLSPVQTAAFTMGTLLQLSAVFEEPLAQLPSLLNGAVDHCLHASTFWGRKNTVGTREEPLPCASGYCLHLSCQLLLISSHFFLAMVWDTCHQVFIHQPTLQKMHLVLSLKAAISGLPAS